MQPMVANPNKKLPHPTIVREVVALNLKKNVLESKGGQHRKQQQNNGGRKEMKRGKVTRIIEKRQKKKERITTEK